MAAGTAVGASGGEDYTPSENDEYERLFEFRKERFAKLGLNEFQAFALADAHVDWHDAERLIKSGCPTDVAVDILL